MRMPYPFKVPVDLDAEDVRVKIMVDMPVPLNLTVHMANEHARNSLGLHSMVVEHLESHLYGEFREGADHYHVRGEGA